MLNYALKNPGENVEETSTLTANRHPIVIIGSGPVGIRSLQLLVKQDPKVSVVIYGNEPWEPYNRVQLSTFLAGELDWLGLTRDQKIPESDTIITRFNCPVTQIERFSKYILDDKGHKQYYSRLIIATGSSPHVPQIRGIELQGIYNFRDFNDVQHLLARRVRSRRTVVIGGGVLGLEAARAMRRANTEVVVVDHNNHLMSSQLDDSSAELLKSHVATHGIDVHLNSSVKQINGENRVTSVTLRNGIEIECDTIVLATGIRPNIDLARQAGIVVGRGIKVNDRLQTSDENIYAVGECAEHRKIVYGLVAPGYEQARVAVFSLLGKKNDSILTRTVSYKGSIASTTLKVVGIDVFSMGDVHAEESKGLITHYIYQDSSKGIYRKLIIKRRHLIGAISIGPWEQIGRIQESVVNRRFIWPLQLRKFSRMGEIDSESYSEDITTWPASTQICNCAGITRGEISKAYSQGNCTVEALASCTGASLVCGSCKPKLAQFVGAAPTLDPDKRFKSLLGFSTFALLLTALFLFIQDISYNASVDVVWQWDKLWRENIAKQITGFTAIGVMFFAALISLRKRIKAVKWFEYANWRLVHVILSVIAIVALVLHSGMRFGNNLNFYLMATVIALTGLGVFASLTIGIQHRLDHVTAKSLREKFLWTHIFLLWPLPVLLGFHIFKTYYY